MKYETKARPITTADELDAALAAGAQVEYTACGCGYALPSHDQPRSGGWIEYGEMEHRWVPLQLAAGRFTGASNRLRAFYPARRPLLSRLAFWRKAA